MAYPFIQARKVSYGGTRNLSAIYFIAIHYTGNSGDTARGNANYFKNGNTRSAGAHFFVSQDGDVVQTIAMNRVAYSVGGFVTSKYGAASYYKKCTNTNSVSIELCDNVNKDPSVQQIAAVRDLIAYIQSQCPNARTIVRHWDVSGKSCPARMTGTDNERWKSFLKAIKGGSLDTYSTEVTTVPGQLDVDGIAGFKTVKALQHILGTPVDGVISSQFTWLKKYHQALRTVEYGYNGSDLVRAIQKTVGVSVDGQLGPDTIRAIQRRVGSHEDGYFGPNTVKALQTRLNTGTF